MNLPCRTWGFHFVGMKQGCPRLHSYKCDPLSLSSPQLLDIMATTEHLPPGIYRSFVAGSINRQCLTNELSGARPDEEQEWRILLTRDDKTINDPPSNLFTTTYNGAPSPDKSKQIDLRVSKFPLNEWHYSTGPEYQFACSELGIRASPLIIHPHVLY